jgi:hypothetical protein
MYDAIRMRLKFLLLASVWVAALSGCGGGGGGGSNPNPNVTNTQFRIQWPERTRDLMPVTLTSAQSATITLNGAGPTGGNVTVNIERDPERLTGYIGTYIVAQPINRNRLSNATATFYALPDQSGDVVGTATTTVSLNGDTVEFAPITLTGKIFTVDALSTTVTVGNAPTQLLFSARDEQGNTVAVTPGSAHWTVMEGGDFITVTPDGRAAGISLGTAQVRVSIDGIESQPTAIQVATPSAPVYGFLVQKEGQLIEPSFHAVEGNKFEVTGTRDVMVTKLGYEAARGEASGGITAIFDADGNILASATISSADSLENGYYYKAITPIILSPGAQYYIGSLHATGAAGAYLWNTHAAATPSFIADLGSAYKGSSTIEGGTWTSPGQPRHYVGNFQAHEIQ